MSAPCNITAATSAPTISRRCRPRAASRPTARRGCGSSGTSRNSSKRTGSTSRSASRASIRNSWSARTRCCSSTPCSAGRWCRRPICPAAARPIRFRRSACGCAARPIDSLTFLAGVFNGSPVAEQHRRPAAGQTPSGTSFPLNGGALAIAETAICLSVARHAWSTPIRAEPLARVYKLGFWYDTEHFADQRYRQYRPVARQPAEHRHPAAASRRLQHLCRRRSDDLGRSATKPTARSTCSRARWARPQADRNLIDFSLNAGLDLPRAVPAPRRRHVRHRHGLRPGQQPAPRRWTRTPPSSPAPSRRSAAARPSSK